MAKSSTSPVCSSIQWLVSLVLFLIVLAALFGVYRVHIYGGGSIFGSNNSSMSLLTLAIAVSLWGRQMCICLKPGE